MSEHADSVAPYCTEETIWKLAQKWMGEVRKPQTEEEWKRLLENLIAWFGGALNAYESTRREWEEQFPEPECYPKWDAEGSENCTLEEVKEVHRYIGHQEALEFLERRHSEVGNDIRFLLCGR